MPLLLQLGTIPPHDSNFLSNGQASPEVQASRRLFRLHPISNGWSISNFGTELPRLRLATRTIVDSGFLARESKVTGGTVGLLLQTKDQDIFLLLPIKVQSAGPSRRVVLHRRHVSFFLSPLHRELALKRTLRTKLSALELKVSPFWALSTPRFAIKASLFSVFRDLRYSLNNIPGFAIFQKTLHRFCEIPFNFANS